MQFFYVLEEYIIASCMHEKNSDINVFGIKKATITTPYQTCEQGLVSYAPAFSMRYNSIFTGSTSSYAE